MDERDSLVLCDPDDIAYLKKRDRILARFMELAGTVSRAVIPDPFAAIIHTIAGQQISSKVHAVLWDRLRTNLAPLTYEHFAKLTLEDLRAVGLSRSKALYIQGVTCALADGRLNLDALTGMNDDEVRKTLCSLKGIGPWSAEMILIFCLRRPNVLSRGDYGIQRGLRMLYRKKELSSGFFDRIQKRWSPRATTGSLYLWELASGKYPGYSDPAEKKA